MTFLLPGFGPHSEVYDMLDVNDRACWKANAAAYPQASVTPVSFIELPDDRPRRVRAWFRLLRMRGAQAKALGLTVRTS